MKLKEQNRLNEMTLEQIQEELKDKIFDAIQPMINMLHEQGRIKTNAMSAWVALYAMKILADRWIK